MISEKIKLSFYKNSLIKQYYLWKYANYSLGSKEWLIHSEIKYGGIATKVKRNRISNLDPRSQKIVNKGGMIGGDRMLYHGYANKYSQYFLPYIQNSIPIILVEVGILKGVGLALWCDLFPNGRIIGFDIDLNHFKNNQNNLQNLGAFINNKPELYEFDQFEDNRKYIKDIINHDKINICIDDGLHSNQSIMQTMKSITPFLDENFIYIIEDNNNIVKEVQAAYPNYNIYYEGSLTIVTNK